MSGIKNRKIIPFNDAHKNIEGIIHKLCTQCDEWLPMNEENFYKNNTIIGFMPYCKTCTKKKQRKWAVENEEKYKKYKYEYAQVPENKERMKNQIKETKRNNPDRYKGYVKDYQNNNKDKIKGYNKKRAEHKKHTITKEEWVYCKEYFNNSCAYCGITEKESKIKYKQRLHKEHLIYDGSNGIDNCIPACKSCNGSKWQHSFGDWYVDSNEVYSEERKLKILKWINEDSKNIK